MLLDNIALFLKIVEKGSLTAAGREVGLSPTGYRSGWRRWRPISGWYC